MTVINSCLLSGQLVLLFNELFVEQFSVIVLCYFRTSVSQKPDYPNITST